MSYDLYDRTLRQEATCVPIRCFSELDRTKTCQLALPTLNGPMRRHTDDVTSLATGWLEWTVEGVVRFIPNAKLLKGLG